MSASYHQKLKNLLETALKELTSEQYKRKESENKLLELELSLVNKDNQISLLEDINKEKDEKIRSLESSIDNLRSSIGEKDQEILRLMELTMANVKEEEAEEESQDQPGDVEKFEETLNQLLDNTRSSGSFDLSNNDGIISNSTFINDKADGMNVDETRDSPGEKMEEEEYILDESLEEFQNEENNLDDIAEAVDIKEDFNEDFKEDFKEDFTFPAMKASSSDVKNVVKVSGSGKDCPTCGEIFPTKSLLKEHQKELDHLPRFECEVCFKTFKTKGTCQQHKLRIHSDVKQFKCSKCEKRFKDAGSCRRHEANDSVHIRNENIKHNPNLLCNVCGKEFDRNRRWCLDQHYLSHLSSKGRFLNLSEKTKKLKK